MKDLSIKGIWLTPFLSCPKVDNGYDIANYYEVDLACESKSDFVKLLNEAHQRGLKVIMDMVLNDSLTKWTQNVIPCERGYLR